MRDHLLGCQAFLPPEPEPQDRTIHLRKRYPMGLPARAAVQLYKVAEKDLCAKQEITAFEDFDHTPEHMRNDFPREYDLQTMLKEAAGRFKFFGADLAEGPDFSAFLADYDAEMQKLCGL
jgi:hypothetical protein